MPIGTLLAGGLAGLAVDVALFPLDTIKTRAQAREGFLKAGGFTGVYRGLGPAALGSFPGAAVFFYTYESCKHEYGLSHLQSACVGEVMACLVRVPTENLKQNLQTNRFAGVRDALRQGVRFYNGYLSTVAREIPFSAIQFPIWEWGKAYLARGRNKQPASPLESAVCGSVAGGIAAAVTTPIDVVKTRLMTSPGKYDQGMISAARVIFLEEGGWAFTKGWQARVVWISLGGLVFFGTYEGVEQLLVHN
jgi:solute carrier family 25 S-adenosylmethionine transporter 26